MAKILKTLGMIVIGGFLIGLAVEAATKFTVGLIMAAFWGLVLMGFFGLAFLLFGGKHGGNAR